MLVPSSGLCCLFIHKQQDDAFCTSDKGNVKLNLFCFSLGPAWMRLVHLFPIYLFRVLVLRLRLRLRHHFEFESLGNSMGSAIAIWCPHIVCVLSVYCVCVRR